MASAWSGSWFVWLCALCCACGASSASRPHGVSAEFGAGSKPAAPSTAPHGVPLATPRAEPSTSTELDAEVFDDTGAESADVTAQVARNAEPRLEVSDAELERKLLSAPGDLGAMSLGSPSNGRLFGAVTLNCTDLCSLVDPNNAWTTPETAAGLMAALAAVRQKYPSAPVLSIGHVSGKHGGPLAPHSSHQAGRDIDIGFYYRGGRPWYTRGGAGNLDLALTWEFIKALLANADVELILLDQALQRLVFDYARRAGEDPDFLRGLFQGAPGLPRLVRHAPGHATHLHVRFFNPVAQELGRRCYGLLVKHDLITPIVQTQLHRVRRGETLGQLARRYGTTVPALKRANHIVGNLLREKKLYRVPVGKPYTPPAQPLALPTRRIAPVSATERATLSH